MHRVAYLVLGSCLFVALPSFAGPLMAGEYGGRHVRYGSDCCYEKVVRPGRDVRYVPAGRYARPYVYEQGPRVYARPQPHCIVQQSAFRYAFHPNEPRC